MKTIFTLHAKRSDPIKVKISKSPILAGPSHRGQRRIILATNRTVTSSTATNASAVQQVANFKIHPQRFLVIDTFYTLNHIKDQIVDCDFKSSRI